MFMIGTGQYTFTPQTLQSTGSTAAWLNSTASVVDGRPGTQSSFSWPTGAQTTSTFTTIPFRVTSAPATELRMFALLNLTGIPAGCVVQLVHGATSNPTTILATTSTLALPGGRVGAWVVRGVGLGVTSEYVGWKIFNNVGGSTAMTAGQTVRVGEVYADSVYDMTVSDLSVQLTDPTRINRSSGNQPWNAYRRPYRTVNARLTAASFAGAFIDSGNLQSILFALATRNYFGVVFRDRARGATVPSIAYAQQCGMLARMQPAGAIQADAVNDLWPCSLQFEELL